MSGLEKLHNFMTSKSGDSMVFSKQDGAEIHDYLKQCGYTIALAELTRQAIESKRPDLDVYLEKVYSDINYANSEYQAMVGERSKKMH